MYEVQWLENGKESAKRFEDRDEAFKFQDSLLARRKVADNGAADVTTKGVWRV